MKSNLVDGKPGQARQGDVLITPVEVSKVDPYYGDKGMRVARYVVAHGEGTGHDHVLEAEQMTVWPRGLNATLVSLPVGGKLVHTSGDDPDHYPIEIAPGVYWFTRQNDNVEMESQRRVLD